jgi:hypothetical protein
MPVTQEDIMSETTDYSTTDVIGDVEALDADNADVDYDGGTGEDDEVEFVPTTATEGDKPAKEAKPPKEKARGDLPEGFVTPVGLAHVLTERGLGGKEEDGSNKTVQPQVVYSYIKNAPAAYPFPGGTVKDSLGKDRDNVVEVEKGVAWWEAKNQRAAERRANASKKAQEAAAKAAAKAAGTSTPAETAEAAPVAEEAE